MVEHLDDVRVADAGRSLCLTLETLDVLIVGGDVGAQDAHDDVAVQLVVVRSVNIRCSAAADALAQVKALGDLDHDDA